MLRVGVVPVLRVLPAERDSVAVLRVSVLRVSVLREGVAVLVSVARVLPLRAAPVLLCEGAPLDEGLVVGTTPVLRGPMLWAPLLFTCGCSRPGVHVWAGAGGGVCGVRM